jgi:hypothetical protein
MAQSTLTASSRAEKAGDSLVKWRKLVCGVLVFVLAASLMAQDLGRAMLHNDGGTRLNGNPAPESSAIFPHDLVQTRNESTAKIDVDGSTVTIQPDTLVQYDGDELFLDHGSLQLNSARGMRVRVNCMTITPLTQERTRYDVIEADGKVMVVARDNDVRIHYRRVAARQSKDAGSSDVTVHRSEQVTRAERCSAESQPAFDGNGPILNSPWAKLAGGTAIGVLTCWALCRGHETVSPDNPDKP